MPQWLIGLIIPIAAGGVVSVVVGLMKRYATEALGEKLGKAYCAWLDKFDIPVISGDAETKLKYGFIKSPIDICRGFLMAIESRRAQLNGEAKPES